MKTYWDSSALVQSLIQPDLQLRLKSEKGFTRPHALAETFSTLTGNPATRIDADSAVEFLSDLVANLKFIDLSGAEILRALKHARQKGVRGGRVHDYLHVIAAEKSGAKKILTLDKNDFADLTSLQIEQA
jgi:predicted nucleic acid-binding protein